jgi:COMPASS component SWD2
MMCTVVSHNDYCVLSAGKKQNSIQYWSLYDNKIVRKFRGHTSNVHDISLCPTEDMFLSSSSDTSGSVRLWNLQQAGCMAKLDLPAADKTGGSAGQNNTHAVFDHTGMIFTVMAEMPKNDGHYIHLYDARNYGGGAFSEWKITTQSIHDAMKTHRITTKVDDSNSLTINKIDFNSAGDRILCQSKEGIAIIIDGFEGTIQRIFEPSAPLTSKGTVSCFTPDGKSVLMGNDTGSIDVYDIQSGTIVKQLGSVDNGNDTTVGVTALTCNPKYKQIASSCTNTW